MWDNDRVDAHYLIALHDIVEGIDIRILDTVLEELEVEEDYEACEGIARALEFCKDKTINEITKEYDDTLDRIAEEVEE